LALPPKTLVGRSRAARCGRRRQVLSLSQAGENKQRYTCAAAPRAARLARRQLTHACLPF
jgi:hypothetical protein